MGQLISAGGIMRIFVIIAALLLAACATKPTGESFTYKGVHVAGGVMIDEDGQFQSTATVWRAADVDLAREAAIIRLAKAANDAGYSHVIVASIDTTSGLGSQVAIRGEVFRDGSNDVGWPLFELEEAIANPGRTKADLAPKPLPVRKPFRAVAPVETPQKAPAAPLAEPVVIEAPDFISAVPTRRPVG